MGTPSPRARAIRRPRPSHDRNGARWTLYGLPGGYTTAAPVGALLFGHAAQRAVPLLTFRGGPDAGTDRYGGCPRLPAARGWALVAFELVP